MDTYHPCLLVIGGLGVFMLRGEDAMSGMTPHTWWIRFESDYNRFDGSQKKILQRLSEATEVFRPDEWRHDSFFVKIWLAYLDTL